eukprot:GDKJ01049988.1.p1 GENE.GDKJ01049988.1~~GDKJ01049988.1.p1  ORF type:complete len:1621 (-),score=542.70 GDKJ01049988.1:145-4626(-)
MTNPSMANAPPPSVTFPASTESLPAPPQPLPPQTSNANLQLKTPFPPQASVAPASAAENPSTTSSLPLVFPSTSNTASTTTTTECLLETLRQQILQQSNMLAQLQLQQQLQNSQFHHSSVLPPVSLYPLQVSPPSPLLSASTPPPPGDAHLPHVASPIHSPPLSPPSASAKKQLPPAHIKDRPSPTSLVIKSSKMLVGEESTNFSSKKNKKKDTVSSPSGAAANVRRSRRRHHHHHSLSSSSSFLSSSSSSASDGDDEIDDDSSSSLSSLSSFSPLPSSLASDSSSSLLSLDIDSLSLSSQTNDALSDFSSEFSLKSQDSEFEAFFVRNTIRDVTLTLTQPDGGSTIVSFDYNVKSDSPETIALALFKGFVLPPQTSKKPASKTHSTSALNPEDGAAEAIRGGDGFEDQQQPQLFIDQAVPEFLVAAVTREVAARMMLMRSAMVQLRFSHQNEKHPPHHNEPLVGVKHVKKDNRHAPHDQAAGRKGSKDQAGERGLHRGHGSSAASSVSSSESPPHRNRLLPRTHGVSGGNYHPSQAGHFGVHSFLEEGNFSPRRSEVSLQSSYNNKNENNNINSTSFQHHHIHQQHHNILPLQMRRQSSSNSSSPPNHNNSGVNHSGIASSKRNASANNSNVNINSAQFQQQSLMQQQRQHLKKKRPEASLNQMTEPFYHVQQQHQTIKPNRLFLKQKQSSRHDTQERHHRHRHYESISKNDDYDDDHSVMVVNERDEEIVDLEAHFDQHGHSQSESDSNDEVDDVENLNYNHHPYPYAKGKNIKNIHYNNNQNNIMNDNKMLMRKKKRNHQNDRNDEFEDELTSSSLSSHSSSSYLSSSLSSSSFSSRHKKRESRIRHKIAQNNYNHMSAGHHGHHFNPNTLKDKTRNRPHAHQQHDELLFDTHSAKSKKKQQPQQSIPQMKNVVSSTKMRDIPTSMSKSVARRDRNVLLHYDEQHHHHVHDRELVMNDDHNYHHLHHSARSSSHSSQLNDAALLSDLKTTSLIDNNYSLGLKKKSKVLVDQQQMSDQVDMMYVASSSRRKRKTSASQIQLQQLQQQQFQLSQQHHQALQRRKGASLERDDTSNNKEEFDVHPPQVRSMKTKNVVGASRSAPVASHSQMSPQSRNPPRLLSPTSASDSSSSATSPVVRNAISHQKNKQQDTSQRTSQRGMTTTAVSLQTIPPRIKFSKVNINDGEQPDSSIKNDSSYLSKDVVSPLGPKKKDTNNQNELEVKMPSASFNTPPSSFSSNVQCTLLPIWSDACHLLATRLPSLSEVHNISSSITFPPPSPCFCYFLIQKIKQFLDVNHSQFAEVSKFLDTFHTPIPNLLSSNTSTHGSKSSANIEDVSTACRAAANAPSPCCEPLNSFLTSDASTHADAETSLLLLQYCLSVLLPHDQRDPIHFGKFDACTTAWLKAFQGCKQQDVKGSIDDVDDWSLLLTAITGKYLRGLNRLREQKDKAEETKLQKAKEREILKMIGEEREKSFEFSILKGFDIKEENKGK